MPTTIPHSPPSPHAPVSSDDFVEDQIANPLQSLELREDNAGLVDTPLHGLHPLVDQTLHPTDIQLIGEIGRGLTTVLFAGTLVATGRKVAIKKPLANVVAGGISDDADSAVVQGSDDFARLWQEEAKLMKTVGQHPNICQFIGACLDDSADIFLCYEYLGGGSLSHLVLDHSLPIDPIGLAMDIAAGMTHLHSANILHRDLKSGNIMLDCQGRAKLCDFGLSCFIRPDGEPTAETGTYRWMAPEVIRHEKYSFPADVYSFGIVLWEMHARAKPFDDMTPIQAAFGVAKNNLRPVIPPHLSRPMKALLTRCWHPNPTNRPTFEDILQALSTCLNQMLTCC